MFITSSSSFDMSKLLVVGGVVCFTGVAPRTSRTGRPATLVFPEFSDSDFAKVKGVRKIFLDLTTFAT